MQVSDEVKQAFLGIVTAVEEVSSAELVVAVRQRSASYLHVDLLVGIVAAIAVLGFLIFCPWPIAWMYLLIGPVLVGVASGLVASRTGYLRHWLSRPETMQRSARQSARAAFVEMGVHNTTGRTGVLLYLSLLEGQCVLVPDTGVELAVPAELWQGVEAELGKTLNEGLAALAKDAGEKLTDLLPTYLPRLEDDKNELPNEMIL